MSALLKLLIWLGVYLNVAGWALSSVHQLNATGYGIALLVFLLCLGWFRREFDFRGEAARWLHRARRRFPKPFPLLFLVVLGLVLLGGALYAPSNYDALTYRLPRILNWLDAGRWFWISGVNDRMNYSGVGAEWLAVPQIALLHTDRTLFLFNVAGFALMPGLLFSVCRRLGVGRRTATVWMWLLPLACGYVLQAGSVGNDFTGAILCLASVHFGLSARTSGRVGDVWLALLAAALMTGVKLSNLPLALPCLVAVWPALPLLRRAVAKSFAVLCLGAVASALPIMVLNQLYCGNWGGDPQNTSQIQVKNPVAALLGNSLQLAQSSLLPPILPGALTIYQRMNDALPASWHEYLHREFPRYYLGGFQELPSEEGAGLGLGITASLAAALIFGLRRRPAVRWASPAALLSLAALLAFGVYMAKMGSEATARLLLPYYPLLLLPILKLPVQEQWLRQRAWRLWLLLVGLSILPAIILSPSRPLWPAQTISTIWLEKHPNSKLAQRLATTYTTYANRNDLLRPLREQIPAEARRIALAAGSNDAEYSLWRPFGSRAVYCFWRGRDRQEPVLPADLEWLVVHVKEWNYRSPVPLEEWAARHGLKIVATIPITTFAKHGADDWCVLRRETKGATP